MLDEQRLSLKEKQFCKFEHTFLFPADNSFVAPCLPTSCKRERESLSLPGESESENPCLAKVLHKHVGHAPFVRGRTRKM